MLANCLPALKNDINIPSWMLINGSMANIIVFKSLTIILIFYSLKLYNILYITVL